MVRDCIYSSNDQGGGGIAQEMAENIPMLKKKIHELVKQTWEDDVKKPPHLKDAKGEDYYQLQIMTLPHFIF